MDNIVLYIIIIVLILYIINSEYNTDRYSDMSKNGVLVYWFHRPGCPHCDNMKGEWEKVEATKLPSKYKLMAVNTALKKNSKLSEDFGIEGVPQIIKVVNNKRIVYKGNRTAPEILKWIKS